MQTAILDSCVLYPAPLRDFFMRLAVKLYQPKWTEAIHEEWIRNVLENRPDLTLTQLTRTRQLMDRHGGACLVTGYEDLISTLSLPDPDDRHVLAAAIKAHASVIVTFNLSDFPAQTLAAHHTRAVHPDDFAVSLYDIDADLFVQLVKVHRQALVNPSKEVEEYLSTLSQCGLKKTVARLEPHRAEI
ncbi:MAG TPA: PIN domain-containing protein [Chthonomonadaceae bacterium]|nr:PIN domain-containing protein [Chthonomonadaceae bacterium]